MTENKEVELVTLKVEYWQELWQDSIKNFLKRSFGLALLTPHVLIDNIIQEIEEDSLQNVRIRKFFYRTLSKFLENDEVIKTYFKNDFSLLRRNFNCERIGYILTICQSIQKKFRKGKYFDGLVDKIYGLVSEGSPIDGPFLQKMNYYTQAIIVEFLLKTYTFEEIKRYPDYIFRGYEFLDDGRIYSHFPHKTDIKDFMDADGIVDQDSFAKVLMEELDTLNLKSRIKALGNYYYETDEDEAYYIFVVEGLRGNQVIKIGDVTFYSPEKTRFIKDLDDPKGEYEKLQSDELEEKYLQAAVKVKYRTYQSSLSEAIEKVENCIDLVYGFFSTQTKMKVLMDRYIVVKEGKYIGSSWHTPKDNKELKFNDALDIDYNRELFSGLKKHSAILKLNSRTAKKVRNAMHWIRKGEDSDNDADKLVYYWIAIENLFSNFPKVKEDILGNGNASKFDLIKEVLGSNQLLNYVYGFGWDLFHYYRNLENQILTVNQFPETLAKRANLKSKGKKMYLKKFLKQLPKLRKYETNPFLLDKIDSLINFYQGTSNTIKALEEQKTLIEDDITMIYRFRNLIVHSATFDKTLLPYYVWKARTFSRSLVKQILWNFEGELDIEEIFTKMYLKKEKYFERLKNEMIVFPEDLE